MTNIKRITKIALKEKQEFLSFIDTYGTTEGTKELHIVEVLNENKEPDYELSSLMNALADVNREREKLIKMIEERL